MVNVIELVVNAESVARRIVKLVALFALLVQFKLIAPPTTVAVSELGASGGYARHMGRIMSFSSCPKKWQWSTYSQPKFVN